MKACTIPLSRLEGKAVTTIEGLSKREADVYAYCFAEAGAVQCGYCTPGMIISAKSLLDVNLNPTLEDVKKAIHGNICRCTGYKKIEEAILESATFFRENREVPDVEEEPKIDKRYRRVDAQPKALGRITSYNVCYTKLLRHRAFLQCGCHQRTFPSQVL